MYTRPKARPKTRITLASLANSFPLSLLPRALVARCIGNWVERIAHVSRLWLTSTNPGYCCRTLSFSNFLIGQPWQDALVSLRLSRLYELNPSLDPSLWWRNIAKMHKARSDSVQPGFQTMRGMCKALAVRVRDRRAHQQLRSHPRSGAVLRIPRLVAWPRIQSTCSSSSAE